MNRIQKFIGCSFLSILMVGVMITPIAAETDFDSVEGSWIVESLDENGNLVLTEGKAVRRICRVDYRRILPRLFTRIPIRLQTMVVTLERQYMQLMIML